MRACLASIDAWAAHLGVANVGPAINLDVLRQPWPIAQVDAVLCINMIHITPWEATVALFEGAGRLETPRYDRDTLGVEQRIAGPAIIEDEWSTIVVDPYATAWADALGHLHIDVGGAP